MSDEDIPIDIYYNKLLDWLISRQHCPQQWQANAITVRESINDALQDMPPVDEITQLLQGTYINYFHCQRIVKLLKGTEDGSKNIFGRYSSQRMKDWVDILKIYEKDNTFIAEAAQLLMRNINYEIPALKRQVTKCQQAQTDCIRKEEDYATQSAELKEKYKSTCKQMGIKGERVKSELLELVKDMPCTYESLTVQTQKLSPAVAYYSAFVTFTLQSEECAAECCTFLKYLIDKGNTTVFEWRTGKLPLHVEKPAIEYGNDEEETNIKYDAVEEIESDGGIDWGGNQDEIDIEVIEDSTMPVHSSEDDSVARGTDALTLLDSIQARNVYVDELMELEAFLAQRVHEMKDDSSVLSGSQLQTATSSVQISIAEVGEMLRDTQDLLSRLTSQKMQDLLLIRSSPRYVERLADSLNKILSDSAKMASLSRLMVTRRQEAQEEEVATSPKIDLIRQRTKELQKQIEFEISKKYKGRRVNIMGEINTI